MTSIFEPWHAYALDVRSGAVPACKKLLQAVDRYFSDLEDPRYYFDAEAVRRFMKFSRFCPHVKGHLRGKPIELEPWQLFLFANVLGLKRRDTNRRKYTAAFVMVSRKNAKSTTAAVLLNWFLAMEQGQHDIYTAAVSRDQARIVFDDAKSMVLLSPAMQKRVKVLAHSMKAPATNSMAKPLAAKAATIEGTNPSLSIVDEYHLHPDNAVYSALELGMGARLEPLLFAITTAGTAVISACKAHYDYCARILAGEEDNESLFALIYELDDEREVDDPAMWVKANPNIDVSVSRQQLAYTVKKARGIPSQWTEMLTKRFNIWCQGATPWMPSNAWAECFSYMEDSQLIGHECYLGMDLSSTGDITSISYAFPFGETIRVLSRHYIPEAQLTNPANKNREQYREWVRAGHLRTTPGNIIDYDLIRDDILADRSKYQIKLVGFDTWNATHIRTQLMGAGLDVVPFSQTFGKYSPVCKALEVFAAKKIIRHNGDPVLAWALSNVVMMADNNANIKPAKLKSANKIDPAVALIMAVGVLMDECQDFGFEMTDQHREALKTFAGV